jgi:hypothetical protein
MVPFQRERCCRVDGSARRSLCVGDPERMTHELTEERIAEAMPRAEKVACRPSEDRCYALPDLVEAARASCTPKGQCKIGWIISNGGRESFDVWLDLETGEGRLRRQVD